MDILIDILVQFAIKIARIFGFDRWDKKLGPEARFDSKTGKQIPDE